MLARQILRNFSKFSTKLSLMKARVDSALEPDKTLKDKFQVLRKASFFITKYGAAEPFAEGTKSLLFDVSKNKLNLGTCNK